MNRSPAIPETGYLDLHCHLLPGIDDGCRDVPMSLACIRLWKAAGFSGAVCTPHVATTWFPENTPVLIEQWVAALRHELDRAQLEFCLWTGGEVRLSDRVIGWFEQHGVPTLGPGRCVLIDWWGNDWPEYCYDACRYLLDRHYQPILAHPERMGLPDAELVEVIQQLRAMGVWLQGNLNSISGGEGEYPETRAAAWLEENAYFTLASDTHEPLTVPSRIAGLEKTRVTHGPQLVERLLKERPREILNWQN